MLRTAQLTKPFRLRVCAHEILLGRKAFRCQADVLRTAVPNSDE